MQSSDPNFQQSADCRKLASPAPKQISRKRSVQKNYRSCFLLLRSSVFFEKSGKNNVFFLKKSPTSQKKRFRLLRTWGFACESLSLAPFSSSTPSLLSSDSEFHSFPSLHDLFSETCKNRSISYCRAIHRAIRSNATIFTCFAENFFVILLATSQKQTKNHPKWQSPEHTHIRNFGKKIGSQDRVLASLSQDLSCFGSCLTLRGDECIHVW